MVQNKKSNSLNNQNKLPMSNNFVPTEMGSARFVSLEGKSSYKYEGDSNRQNQPELGPPWSVEPSLSFKCDEIGIDFDEFINHLKDNKTDDEIAESFGVSQKTIEYLRKHFMTKGIASTSEIITG